MIRLRNPLMINKSPLESQPVCRRGLHNKVNLWMLGYQHPWITASLRLSLDLQILSNATHLGWSSGKPRAISLDFVMFWRITLFVLLLLLLMLRRGSHWLTSYQSRSPVLHSLWIFYEAVTHPGLPSASSVVKDTTDCPANFQVFLAPSPAGICHCLIKLIFLLCSQCLQLQGWQFFLIFSFLSVF